MQKLEQKANDAPDFLRFELIFAGVAMALCFCLRSAYQMDLLETHLRFRANVVKSGLDNQSSLSASRGHFQPYWQDLSDYTAIKRTMLDL